MPDRILRDELWESDRFLDLPTDTARLIFVRCLSLADDFGNFAGAQTRLYRAMQSCTQIKTPEALTSAIDALMQQDLLRRYEVDATEYFHIPRFRSHKQYLSRRVPPSPWCDSMAKLGKDQRNKHKRENVVATSLLRSSSVAVGVGVGVTQYARAPPVDNWQTTEQGIQAKAAELGIPARPGESYAAWRDRLLAALHNKA